MKFVHWIFCVCLLTASFDVFLNFNFGGSLRLAQILMVLVCLAAMGHAVQQGRVLWPRGSTSLTLWMVAQLLFIPLSGNAPIAVQFFVLLLFSVVGILAVVQLYGQGNYIESLMRAYMLSYAFVGAFGLLQFTLPLLGLPSILVAQWIVHGKLARINGFSYEPSYFATYLVMGWIMLVDLRISKARIASGKLWMLATALVTAALFLSTSKTAWVFMIVELVARLVPIAWRAFRRSVHQVRMGRLLVPVPSQRFVLYTVVSVAVLFVGAVKLTQTVDPMAFLSGTGIGGTAAHSFNDRHNAVVVTYTAFTEHPFLGRSLGGVPIYLASRSGLMVHNMAEVRTYWGFPVLLDVLVASGLIAFVPFLMFLYANSIGAWRLAKRRWPEERAKWLRALARAMVFEWMLLMTDQNLLRVYLWFHITMVAVVAYHLEFADAPGPAVSIVPARAEGVSGLAAAS